MKSRRSLGAAGLLAVLLAFGVAAPAAARNAEIAGGIQYTFQANKERQKGNEEDARRIYGKAVMHITAGIAQDSKDLEAWDYLGLAYAELDSAEKAGWAFGEGIARARPKPEEKKLLQRMIDNREHYWVRYFNSAIGTYQKAFETGAEGGQPDITITMQAVTTMRRAVAMNPENAKSYCNLAAFLVNAKHADEAVQAVEEGLKHAPGDSCLVQRKALLDVVAGEKAVESGEYEKATAPYEKLLAADPQNSNAALRLGEIYFKQGQSLEEKAAPLSEGAEKEAARAQARQAFERSAAGFGKYVALKPDDKDGRYNYAIALLRAEKYADAGRLAIEDLARDPASPEFHAVLSSAYRGLDMVDLANGHTLVAKILREGAKEADAAAFTAQSAAKWGAASDAAKLVKEMGAPQEVRTLTMGDYPVEFWLWLAAKRGVIFSKGHMVTDVSFAQMATPAPPKPAAPGRKATPGKATAPGKTPPAGGAPKR